MYSSISKEYFERNSDQDNGRRQRRGENSYSSNLVYATKFGWNELQPTYDVSNPMKSRWFIIDRRREQEG
jgi:hypothetical protein